MDNGAMENFFGRLKVEMFYGEKFESVNAFIDELKKYIDYYNNEAYVWELCMLSPNEYYNFITTGVYPLSIANPPQVPQILKEPSELGTKQGNID